VKAWGSGWQGIEYDDGSEDWIREEEYNGTVKFENGKKAVGVRYQESTVTTQAREELKAAEEALAAVNSAFSEFKQRLENDGISIVDVLSAGEDAVNGLASDFTELGDSVVDTTSKISMLKSEILDLRRTELQSDDDKSLVSKMLNNRRRQLNLLGGSLDPIDKDTDDADLFHQQTLLDINNQKGLISETELAIAKNKELIRYCGDLMLALDNLKNSANGADEDTLHAVYKLQLDILHQVSGAQNEINKATANLEAKNHQDRLTSLQAFYDEQVRVVRNKIDEREVTEGQAEIFLMRQQHNLHTEQLAELKDYYQQTERADYLSAEDKSQLLQQLNDDIKKAQSQVLTDTGEWSKRMRELTTDFTGINGIKRTFEDLQADINATYDEAIKSSP
ncbi:MAG: hypothetical protein K2L81_08255, partial [Muribaculaceae bacterium]|nr:hypothetical protein [Muribaculaceae bacterium]